MITCVNEMANVWLCMWFTLLKLPKAEILIMKFATTQPEKWAKMGPACIQLKGSVVRLLYPENYKKSNPGIVSIQLTVCVVEGPIIGFCFP